MTFDDFGVGCLVGSGLGTGSGETSWITKALVRASKFSLNGAVFEPIMIALSSSARTRLFISTVFARRIALSF